jgi:hypothetical protein
MSSSPNRTMKLPRLRTKEELLKVCPVEQHAALSDPG